MSSSAVKTHAHPTSTIVTNLTGHAAASTTQPTAPALSKPGCAAEPSTAIDRPLSGRLSFPWRRAITLLIIGASVEASKRGAKMFRKKIYCIITMTIMIIACRSRLVTSFASPKRGSGNRMTRLLATNTHLSFGPSPDIRDKATSTILVGRKKELKVGNPQGFLVNVVDPTHNIRMLLIEQTATYHSLGSGLTQKYYHHCTVA